MPTTETCGTPTEANERLGGVPIVHYKDALSRGRGQLLRLFFEDAGVAYIDVRYSASEWPEAKKNHPIISRNPTENIPMVELNGKILTQSYAMVRYFGRVLGAYDGKSEEERYWADAICDIIIDWRTYLSNAAKAPDGDVALAAHKETNLPRYLHAMQTHLTNGIPFSISPTAVEGPFILGTTITYADLVLYQILHDEDLTQGEKKD